MTTPTAPRAVLFDRDGTLVVDVPYNGDSARVQPMPTVPESVGALRRRGIRTGVVSNQQGIGLGRITAADVESVNRAIDALLGPFDVWCVCPHTADAGCGCRKPQPGMILQAAEALRLAPHELAVIGDIGADVDAAAAAGARGILVPTAATRRDEIERAREVAPTVEAAVGRLLAGGADRHPKRMVPA